MVAGASPALVSSLLIHGDQSVSFDVWLSVCPFHTRRAVVNSAFCCATQLPSQFRLVALCCAFTIKSAGRTATPGLALSDVPPIACPVFTGWAATSIFPPESNRCFFPVLRVSVALRTSALHAAASMMAPSSRQGQFKTETPHAMLWFRHHCEWPEILPAPVWRLCF